MRMRGAASLAYEAPRQKSGLVAKVSAVVAPGLIARQKNPDNLEMPFESLDELITPVERLYVRSHFEVPRLSVDTWRLSVEGAVLRPFTIGFAELARMPAETRVALLECAGNGRVMLSPPKSGVQWEAGAVGNIAWTGVPLATLLERVGLRDGAAYVVLIGADAGQISAPEPETPGEIFYARSLPLEKALRPEVILAYQMNGRDLPIEHGYPVRAVVPGWYGMASVKWLCRVLVTKEPFHGYFETEAYSIWERRGGLVSLVPLRELQVKAQIARPAPREVVPADTIYRVFGAAWSGHDVVTRVEVSADGGQHWREAQLVDEAAPFAWRRFAYEWRTPARAGRYVLMARATDARGRTQPMHRDPDLRDVAICHVLPVEIEVR